MHHLMPDQSQSRQSGAITKMYLITVYLTHLEKAQKTEKQI